MGSTSSQGDPRWLADEDASEAVKLLRSDVVSLTHDNECDRSITEAHEAHKATCRAPCLSFPSSNPAASSRRSEHAWR